MSAWKYKRLTPKVIVSRLRLIDHRDIVKLCNKKLEDASSMLMKTPYRPEIVGISSQQLDSASFEKALVKNFIRTCNEVIECSPSDVRSLLLAILMKFEVSNVKTMLRAKEAGASVDQAMGFVTSAGKLDDAACRKILEDSNSVEELVDALADFEYGAALKEALSEYEESETIRALEVALDRFVYGRVWKATARLKGLDGKIARAVLGVEIDSTNVRIVLRCKTMRVSENQTRSYLVASSDAFAENDWEDAIRAADVKSALGVLLGAARRAFARDQLYMLTDIVREYESSRSLSQLEMVLDRSLLGISLRMLKRYTAFFNIGAVLAFLNLKWFEVRNLRAIVHGIESRIPPDRITKMLILP